MNRLIVACIVLIAFAGAEPPQYRQSRFNQKQQEASDSEGYAPAGPPSGPLLLLPGEYLVKVAPNSPIQQYAGPAEVPVVQPLGQYNAAPVAPVAQIQYQPFAQTYQYQQQTFGKLKAAPQPAPQQYASFEYTASPAAFGQLKAAQQPLKPSNPSAFSQQAQPAQPTFGQLRTEPKQKQQFAPQQRTFSEKQQVFAPQANNPNAEVFNPQTFVPETQNQYSGNNKAKAQPQNNNFKAGAKREETEESVAKYQQASGFQQGFSGKYTNKPSASQNEAANQQQKSDFIAQFQQEQTQFAQQQQQYPVFFVNQQYFQQSEQPEVLGQYAQVSQQTASSSAQQSGAASQPDASSEVATSEDKGEYNKDGSNQDSENVDNQAEGLYYLLLPDGKLQKIVYMTKEDLKKMQVFANIQYQNVEPITGPIYSYNPAKSPYAKVL